MRSSAAITGKRLLHRHTRVITGSAPALCGFCCSARPFSGHSYDYRERLSKTRLSDLKLDDAVGLFSVMVQSRPRPSITEFCKLLSAIAKMKRFDVAISLGEQMQNLGISHNLYSYSILINCFCRRSQLSLALAVLGKMMKLGYKLDVVTLNSLLNGFCHSKRIADAVALVDQMVVMGYQPNTVTFTTLIHGLFLHNESSEAVALVERMALKGCQPDLVTYGVHLKVNINPYVGS
ncbi:PREDICTED: pentatricopeptide repeat-containing protein At1g63070, mitochondrial-like [Camelina sativa]|uniref:Pentatricopeptide repeat-containing protein At1g63070, mitochondrial-like n=1 Tax=Camelina sativa TaxID=90675 RepID=A0ABM0TUM3_CAMSA|nr:PREDICTED: pentatricopeptide repeat-containing protein At1g63070, mitochondrial-like [Camelina sativa]